MSSLFFLIRRSFANIIKGAFKKPAVLIGYILMAAFIILMIVMSFIMPSGTLRNGDPRLFKGIMVLVFMFLYYTTIKVGIDKGSTYFRMADVNLVFTAPIKPSNVLLYGFIKQIGGTLLIIMFSIFQIPNLKNNFDLKSQGIFLLFLAVAAYAMSYPLISMVIYSWTSREKRRKKLVQRIIDACALLVAIAFLVNLSQTRNLGTTIISIFDNPVASYFPVIGWTGAIASSALLGFSAEFYVGAAGMLLLIVGMSIALYRMNPDYYEDVLEGTEYVEAALKAKRAGNNINFNVKVKEKVKQKLSGTGAGAIFSKQMLELRKTAYFLFFDRVSVIIIIAALVFKFIMPDETGEMSLFLVLCFSVYMLMLFQMQGRLNTEMDKHYIFLIPAGSYEKLFYSTLAEHVKNLSDGAVLFIASGLLFNDSVAMVIACIIAYMAFGAVFIYTDVLCRRLFGRVHSKGLMFFIKFIASILIQIPGIVAAIVLLIMTESQLIMVYAMGGWSLVLAITLFIFSGGILKNIETAG